MIEDPKTPSLQLPPPDQEEEDDEVKQGQQPHVPTDSTRTIVKVLAGMGAMHERIAGAIGISDKTMRKYYRDELDHGKTQIDAEVFGALMRNIQKGNPASIIFYLKARCGWKDTPDIAPDSLPPVIFNISFAPAPEGQVPDAPVIDHEPTPDKG